MAVKDIRVTVKIATRLLEGHVCEEIRPLAMHSRAHNDDAARDCVTRVTTIQLCYAILLT